MLSLAWTLIDTALRARTINHIQREAGACDHHDAPNCAERTGALAGVHGRVRESPWLLLASSEARVLSRTDPCMHVSLPFCACDRLCVCALDVLPRTAPPRPAADPLPASDAHGASQPASAAPGRDQRPQRARVHVHAHRVHVGPWPA